MPRTFWEFDELLFASAVKRFEPLVQHPHQPGYPLYVGLGKAFAFVFGDPFPALIALSVVSCVVGYIFLARYAGAAAALIFYFSAGALVHLTLPLSDSVAIMFLAIAFATGFRKPRLIPFALACSAAIGARPQLSIALLPIFLAVLIRERKFVAPLLAFTALSLAWFVPLVLACGGWGGFVQWQLHQASYVAAHDAMMSRGASGIRSLIAWFVIHPFGPKWLALPLLFGSAAGSLVMVRHRQFLPLAFGALHLMFALLVMEPADSVRYSLPHVMIFCIAIGAVLNIFDRIVPIVVTTCVAIASIAFTWPLLFARVTRPSPPAAAAKYANATFAPNTIIAYDLSLRPHAEYLMSRFPSMSIDRALAQFYDRPDIPIVQFTDGGSSAPDAKVFAWPHSEAYRILTRNLYEQVTLEPALPGERFLPVRGVYPLERTAEGEEWRWLQQEAEIRLPRAHGSRLTLAFALPHDAPWPQNIVHIAVNGREVAAVAATKRRATAAIEIPLGDVTVTLRAERSFRPAEVLHNQDPRELAVQLVALSTQ